MPRLIVLTVFLSATACCFVYSDPSGGEKSVDKSTSAVAPSLSKAFFADKSNNASKSEEKSSNSNSISNTADASTTKTMDDPKATHKLLNVPVNNGTGTLFLDINLHKLMEDPYVHGIVLPAAIGIIVALVTLLLVCSIRSCIRKQARKRRRRRIRNLAEELKSDQKVLLTTADSSDDEI